MGRPRNLPVAYPVTQVGNWGTGSDDVGLMKSTKAPCEQGIQICEQRSRLRSGEVFAYVGNIQILKDVELELLYFNCRMP